MIGRISREEKGKGIASDPPQPPQPPRSGRIRAQVLDNEDRLQKLSLTLIGRATNRSVQKTWSIIPFLTEHWKSYGRPVGSDLGNGLFQFQFEKEADLLAILDKRPFHFARWMIILQRWEPTTSTSFPSLIPFWIKVQGIPLHLWTENTIRSLGEDIGFFEEMEITDFSVRMKVQVDGLLPLIKSSVIEYPNGDEVTASFVYEKLEKHCSKCFRLDHDVKDCLVAKHQARALKAQEISSKDSVKKEFSKPNSRYPEESGKFQSSETRDRDTFHSRSVEVHRALRGETRRSSETNRRNQLVQDRRRCYKDPPQDWQRPRYTRASHPIENDSYHREPFNQTLRRAKESERFSSRDREERLNFSRNNHKERVEESCSSKNRQSLDPLQNQATPPPTAFEKALGDVRETMHQYTNVADPTESAARRERLRKAEEGGYLENSAARMVRNSSGEGLTRQVLDPESSKERVPVSHRLGPMAQTEICEEALPEAPATRRIPISQRLSSQGLLEDSQQTNPVSTTKKKLGRPPGRKKIPSSPLGLKGTSSRKRNVQRKTPSAPLKRRVPADTTKAGPSKSKPGPSRTRKGAASSTTESENLPICNLIPASSRRKMDFHNPSSLGP
ncbi:hypothetical protein Bca4012_035859 [Brassica carinata]